MRPSVVFADRPGSEIDQLQAGLHGRQRQAARAVTVLLSAHGLSPAQIAVLPDCHPATVRRWISRFNAEGAAGLADRPRSGRPRLGGRCLPRRIAALPARPGPWTLPRVRRCLGRPRLGRRTLCRRARLVAVWRRPRLTARGDPGHDHVAAQIVKRLAGPPRRAVVPAEDETRPRLLPHIRASRTLRTARPDIPTPGKNRQVTVLGAIEVSTGQRACRPGRRSAADFTALLDQLLRAFPHAPLIVVICGNDIIHHARAVTAWLQDHPRLELLHGARYSPHDNPVERVRGALKNYAANTAVSWPGRLRQVHAFSRARSPDQLPATAAPLDQPVATAGLRAELLECRLALKPIFPLQRRPIRRVVRSLPRTSVTECSAPA